MKRLSNLIALSLLLASNAAMAQEVSIDDAKSNALEFLSSKTTGTRRAKGQQVAQDLSLAYTSKSEAKTCFYVFNVGSDEGFVIAGGDESARQILGYCDHGTFDYATSNPAFRWWLGQYTEQIEHAEVNPNAAAEAPRRAKAKKRYSVEPLIKTKWGQYGPYNCELPCSATGYIFPTGCVATAMAQIMNYWKYPEKGNGGNTAYFLDYYYDDNTGEWVDDVSEAYVDFSTTYYDWDHMLTEYKYSYADENEDGIALFTEEEAKAVGTLMYHAGASVNMNYTSDFASAWSRKERPAFVEHFSYDESAEDIQRTYNDEEGRYNISEAEWEELIYDELDKGRPVYYTGTSESDGGHAFICDGYDSETNFFSFNWGWNGDKDGFYSLTAVDERKSYLFSYIAGDISDIIINLMPASFSKEEVYFYTWNDNNYLHGALPIIKGDKLPIKWTLDYDGTPEFSSSDESVATVDANGVITGVSEGSAQITAYAPSTSSFYRNCTVFDVEVGDLELKEQPYFNNDNNIYEDDYVLHYTLKSLFPMDVNGSVNVGFSIDDNLVLGRSFNDLSPQEEQDYDFDLNWSNRLTNKFTAGNQYEIYLYKDDQKTLPFNYPSVTFTYRNKLTVDYGVSSAGYGTLILPFNAELPEGMTIYSCPSVDENGVLTLVEESSIERNKPYIVKATSGSSYHFEGPEAIDADKPSFQEGILVGAVANNVPLQKNTDYILQVQDGKAAFYKYTGTKADETSENDSSGNRLAKQFRAFIRLDSSNNAPKFNLPGFSDEETDGISTLTSDGHMPAGIYSIDGKRQSEFQKGLNILILEDGTAQKVFVK
jgi:hypothetical protein